MSEVYNKLKKVVVERVNRLLSHHGFRRYLKNISWMFFGQMFSLLASFFIGAWLARYLQPDNFGVLNYALSFGGVFAFIATLGVDGILSREFVKYPEKRDNLFGTGFCLKLIGATLAFILTVISAFLFESSSLIRFLILIFSFSFILQTINILSTFFQANVQAKQTIKAQVVATSISSILKILAITMHVGVIWIMLIYVLDSLWNGIVLMLIYKKSGLSIRKWRFDSHLARVILKNSWLLMLASAAWYFYIKIDQVIVGRLMGTFEVGIYAAAVRVAEVWYFVPGIICSSLFPAIVNAKLKDEQTYRNRLRRLYLFMVAIAVIIAIPMSILSKPIIVILFGSGYLASVQILQIYIWSGVGLFLTAAVNQYLLAENMVKTIFLVNLVSMIINIALNFLLIPIFGLSGAAVASLISYFCIPVGVWMFNNFFENKFH